MLAYIPPKSRSTSATKLICFFVVAGLHISWIGYLVAIETYLYWLGQVRSNIFKWELGGSAIWLVVVMLCVFVSMGAYVRLAPSRGGAVVERLDGD